MRFVPALVLSIAVAHSAFAQAKPKSGGAKQPSKAMVAQAPDSSSHTASDPVLRAMQWRLVGPFRGGRAVAVTGDPVEPRTFFMGTVDGGVWKTVDAGVTWINISDDNSTIASVGAIAVAPSDHNVIYVGTGETDFREDLTHGDGMYRSTDGGKHWKHIGLEQTQQIATVRVDPKDPDNVFVAAFGHAFGPNAERGVYHSRDGGATWKRVLFVDDSTGAIDLAMDPTNARILYASVWKFQRFPWGFSGGGGKSGLWKSTDAGDTWTELTDNPGMPDVAIGRIGVSVSAAMPNRVYAYVETSPDDSLGGIYRSENSGESWKRVNGDQAFMVRPWYYGLLTADPSNPNIVYNLNLSTYRSIDGGHTFQEMRVPHGDDHLLWIDPHDSNRMIEGNDGGATISLDGGDHWSSQDNQPTAQFYHVLADNEFPYRLYGAQQDNSSVRIQSRSDDGAITRQNWDASPFGESGYIAVNSTNPDVSYGTSYWGQIQRFNSKTNELRDISFVLPNYDGYAARDVPLRFQWTFPMLSSAVEHNTLYATAQRAFKSSDEGASWRPISPDLTLHDSATLGHVGGPITRDETGTEIYATIFAFAESKLKPGVLWAGSDDGLVHVSQDNGATWQNVTPHFAGKFTRVSIIEPGHFDAGTAYLAANRYQQDDFHPYLYRTTDFGKSWTRIDAGIPEMAYTRVVREDPVKRGLLYAGTETGVYVSFDDGARWQSLQLNLPRSSARDLAVHGSDLAVATHGRSFWVLDNVSPLRQITDAARHEPTHLFTPDTAVRWDGGRSRRAVGVGQNPPSGVTVDFMLQNKPKGAVTLAFLDQNGTTIRTFSSKGTLSPDSAKSDTSASAKDSIAKAQRDTSALKGRKKKIEGADSITYTPSDSVVSARAGMNRFVWNLRYENVKHMEDILIDFGSLSGPMVKPGSYSVRLTVDGQTNSQPFVVVNDPRSSASPAEIQSQLAAWFQLRDKVDSTVSTAKRIATMEGQLDARLAQVAKQSYAPRVTALGKPLRAKLEAIRDELVEVHSHADEITLHYPVKPYNMMLTLNGLLLTGDNAPTQSQMESLKELSGKVDGQLEKLRLLESTDVGAFNRLMKELDVPAVSVKGAKVVM
ncbi:MAG: glycosyl hydrolase [Gemmatimonadota bacterium]|nr:glycosyl hydrolase [Gemmatimonadota bacterium]